MTFLPLTCEGGQGSDVWLQVGYSISRSMQRMRVDTKVRGPTIRLERPRHIDYEIKTRSSIVIQMRSTEIMGEWRAKRDTMESYNARANSYDDQYGEEQSEKHRLALDVIGVEEGEVVLDDGCGTGLFIEKIVGPSSLVVGIDISKGMLSVAKRRCGRLRKVFLILCDADFLPLKEKLFDKVFSFTMIQDIPNPRRAISEITRVSKPGSKVIVTALKKAYTRARLIAQLRFPGLKVIDIPNAEWIRDHIAICERVKRSPRRDRGHLRSPHRLAVRINARNNIGIS